MGSVKKRRSMGKELRRCDPFMDRRSGDDRRKIYSLAYFQEGRVDRRQGGERRSGNERRSECIQLTAWTSVCPDYNDEEYRSGKIHIPSRKIAR